MSATAYLRTALLLSLAVLFFTEEVFAQRTVRGAASLKRTTFKTDKVEFGPGGTISIIGAPLGAIEIEGWKGKEVLIEAEIEVEAANEADLDLLAKVCGFVVDKSMTRVSIVSVGTHDKKYLKKVVKNFPKRLRGAPFRINYKLRVPEYSDIEVDGGNGDFKLASVEGTIGIRYLESAARLTLTGGTVQVTVGKGSVDVTIAKRSWRGRSVEVRIAEGNLNLHLPKNFHADVKARILRSGRIENSYPALKPMRGTEFSDKEIRAVAGNGGASLSFTVGDGTLRILDFEKVAKASN